MTSMDEQEVSYSHALGTLEQMVKFQCPKVWQEWCDWNLTHIISARADS